MNYNQNNMFLHGSNRNMMPKTYVENCIIYLSQHIYADNGNGVVTSKQSIHA